MHTVHTDHKQVGVFEYLTGMIRHYRENSFTLSHIKSFLYYLLVLCTGR